MNKLTSQEMDVCRIRSPEPLQNREDLYAHWTPEDREILKDEGANSMVWMDELAQHEARHD